jgi:hypothetical protein
MRLRREDLTQSELTWYEGSFDDEQCRRRERRRRDDRVPELRPPNGKCAERSRTHVHGAEARPERHAFGEKSAGKGDPFVAKAIASSTAPVRAKQCCGPWIRVTSPVVGDRAGDRAPGSDEAGPHTVASGLGGIRSAAVRSAPRMSMQRQHSPRNGVTSYTMGMARRRGGASSGGFRRESQAAKIAAVGAVIAAAVGAIITGGFGLFTGDGAKINLSGAHNSDACVSGSYVGGSVSCYGTPTPAARAPARVTPLQVHLDQRAQQECGLAFERHIALPGTHES